MKLTNNLRSAFVRAAMADVPSVDFHNEIGKALHKHLTAKRIKLGIDKVPLDRLKHNYTYMGGQSFACVGLTDAEVKEIQSMPDMVALVKNQQEQSTRQNVLSEQLTAAIAGCTTRKQAVDALPEFDKYLPEDTVAAMRSLPAIANVVTDFVKAGWPKNQKRITI